jgi:CBS domain-containing protein
MFIKQEVRQAARHAVDQVLGLRDQARLQLHLLSLDARKRWHDVEKEVAALEERTNRDGEKAAEAIKETAHALSRTLNELLVGQLSHSPGLLGNVRSLMTAHPRSCSPEDSLSHAAQLMWECDCGALPVVSQGKVVAMLSDRDVCMATYLQSKSPSELRVESAMSRELFSCGPDQSVADVLASMADRRVRRLPVTGAGGELLGVISQADLVRWARSLGNPEVQAAVLDALAGISALSPQKSPAAAE